MRIKLILLILTTIIIFSSLNVSANPIDSLKASEIIDETRTLISEGKYIGNVGEVKDLLEEAETAIVWGDSSKALNLANKAKSLLLDADQDGVLNDVDFAPQINNYFIYLGIGVIVIGGGLLSKRRIESLERRRFYSQKNKKEMEYRKR